MGVHNVPKKGDSMPERDRMEGRLQSSVARIFARQLREFPAGSVVDATAASAGRRLKEAQPIDDEIGMMIAQRWPEAETMLAEAIGREATIAAQRAGNLTLDSIGYGQSFTIGDPVRDRLATGSLVSARSIEGTSKVAVRSALTRGFSNEWGRARIVREIENVMGNWQRGRAEMIARTEIAEAWMSTSHETMARNGIQAREWQTAKDERVDNNGLFGPCISNGAAGPVAINDTFPSGHTFPPAHPRCRCNVAPVAGGPPLEQPWTGGLSGGITGVSMPPRIF